MIRRARCGAKGRRTSGGSCAGPLKRVERPQLQDPRQLVQGGAGLLDEARVGEVFRCEAVAVAALHPAGEV